MQKPNAWFLNVGLLSASVAALCYVGFVLPASGKPEKATKPKEIDASRIVLRDASGVARLILSVDGDQPVVSLRDGEERDRLVLSLLKDGSAGIHVYDEKKQILVELASLAAGGSQLNLYDRSRKASVAVAASSENVTGFGIYDAKGRSLAALVSLPDATRQLRLADRKASARAVVDVDPAGAPSLRLTNDKGKTRVLNSPSGDSE